jgi:hypothetical protein
MPTPDYHISFLVPQSPEEVFAAITNVRGWWSEVLEGDSAKLDDVFSYRHGDIHYSKHQIIELIPNERIVWLTLDSALTFVEEQNEWNGTKIIFEVSAHPDGTKLDITHEGLVPDLACFDNCTKGWNYYLQNSLVPLITTRQGKPDKHSN